MPFPQRGEPQCVWHLTSSGDERSVTILALWPGNPRRVDQQKSTNSDKVHVVIMQDCAASARMCFRSSELTQSGLKRQINATYWFFASQPLTLMKRLSFYVRPQSKHLRKNIWLNLWWQGLNALSNKVCELIMMSFSKPLAMALHTHMRTYAHAHTLWRTLTHKWSSPC